MKEGASEGCPLSPLFASFVVARLLQPIDSLPKERAAARLASGDPGDDGFGGISHLLGFVDDISSCVFLPDLPFLCTTLKTLGASLGCYVTHQKQEYSPLATDHLHCPSFTRSTPPSPPQSLQQLPNSPPAHIPLTHPPHPSQSNSPPDSDSLANLSAQTPLPLPSSPPAFQM
jgi:hypothetical protein